MRERAKKRSVEKTLCSTVAKKRSVLSPRIFQIFSKTILLLAVSGDYVRFLLAPASLSLAMDIAGVD
jgi:hypothetical protein